jgi:hypothetical protein
MPAKITETECDSEWLAQLRQGHDDFMRDIRAWHRRADDLGERLAILRIKIEKTLESGPCNA